MSGINQVVLTGTVRKVFEKRTVGDNNLDVLSFSVKFPEGNRESQIVVSAFGDLANELEVDEGDAVVIQGRVSEQRWQDKETEEWTGRHDLVANRVVLVDDLVGDPLDD